MRPLWRQKSKTIVLLSNMAYCWVALRLSAIRGRCRLAMSSQRPAQADTETCLASMPLRMNLVETPADEDAAHTGKTGRVQSFLPLGFGMLYQQSVDVEDVQAAPAHVARERSGWGVMCQLAREQGQAVARRLRTCVGSGSETR